jgi:multidrug efflux system membrane fusion protein
MRSDTTGAAHGRSRGTLLAAVAALALAGAGFGWWWQQRPASGTGEAAVAGAAGASAPRAGGRGMAGPARVQPVSVGQAQQRDIRVLVNVIGTIAAANTAVVHTKADGELKALYFTEGQPVRAGQVLAQIDPAPFQIALASAQAALARDQAQLANAQTDLQRYRDLVAKDAAPRQQADTQEALVAQLKGTVQADAAAVDNARLQLSYTRVVAPISGLAGLKQADLGNVVKAADANGLLSIAQMQPAAVVFAVPDAQLPRIRAQLKAGAALPVEAWDRGLTTRLALGKVASTDNAIDTSTGTIRVKALFPNADNSLFANQFVNIRLQLDTLAGALAVPAAAVQRGAQGNFVYAVLADNAVALRPVVVGAADGDWVAVQGQLQPGDQVVTDGADRLRDGAKVEVIVPGKAGDGRAGRRHGGEAASSPAGAAPPAAAASAAEPAASAHHLRAAAEPRP